MSDKIRNPTFGFNDNKTEMQKKKIKLKKTEIEANIIPFFMAGFDVPPVFC